MKPTELLDEINTYAKEIYDEFCEDNAWSWAHTFENKLSCKVRFAAGVSKLVIIPSGENYVLKIPFVGKIEDTWHSNPDYKVSYDDPNFDEEEAGEYRDDFFPFEYASSFDDYANEDVSWNYCNSECSIYDRAVENGLELYFASEELLGFIGERQHPVYIQERAMVFSDSEWIQKRLPQSKADAFWDELEELGFYHGGLPLLWIRHFIEHYGKDELKRLGDFMKEYHIGDLHSSNVGYVYGDIPILVDYSNFND